MLQCGPFHWGITCAEFHEGIARITCPCKVQVASLAGHHRTHADIGCRDIEVKGASLESPPCRVLPPQAPAGRKGLGGQDASRTIHVRFATHDLRGTAPVEAGGGEGRGWLQRDARLYV